MNEMSAARHSLIEMHLEGVSIRKCRRGGGKKIGIGGFFFF